MLGDSGKEKNPFSRMKLKKKKKSRLRDRQLSMQPVRVRGGRQHKIKHINGKETEI